MKHEDFLTVVQDCLTDTWGSRHYPAAQTNRLWSIVRDLTASEFRYAVESLNLSAVRAPTLGQVRTALLPALSRIAEDKRREKMAALEKQGPCRYCAHSGYVNAYKEDAPLAEYSFICRACPAATIMGFQENRGMRAWDAAMVDQGWRVRFFEDSSELEFIAAQRQVMGLLNCKIVTVGGQDA